MDFMGQMSRIHPLDKLIADDSLFLLEALVPFIEYPYKKMLVLFIKYRELMAIMNSLNNRDYISSCGFDCHPKSTEEMLASMCDFLPGNISSSMKQMKQMMGMMEMMNSQSNKNSEGKDNSNSPFSFAEQIFNNGKMKDVFNNSSFNNPENYNFNTGHNDTHYNDFKDSKEDGLFESVMSILDNENMEY